MDLDGVVLDSFREGMRRIQVLAAIEQIQFGRHTRQTLTQIWGAPGVELLRHGLGVSEEMAEALYPKWERWDRTDPPPLVPGAREALPWLRKNNFTIALLTSRNRQNTEDVLKRHNIMHEFSVITTREEVRHAKPDPGVFRAPLAHLHEEFGIAQHECLYLGDTPSDIMAGHKAGIETLVVQTGPYHIKHTAQYPIALDHVLVSIDELPLWLEEHHDGELTVLPD
jgi:HAD superfamily hydrolase (TIGR01549 family)